MTVPSAMKSSQGMSRMAETIVDAGGLPVEDGTTRATVAKMTPTMTWPSTLAQPPSPRLRCRRTLRKSSTNPTKPSPTIRKSTSMPESVTESRPTRCPTK